jgi:hypothetical protein
VVVKNTSLLMGMLAWKTCLVIYKPHLVDGVYPFYVDRGFPGDRGFKNILSILARFIATPWKRSTRSLLFDMVSYRERGRKSPSPLGI